MYSFITHEAAKTHTSKHAEPIPLAQSTDRNTTHTATRQGDRCSEKNIVDEAACTRNPEKRQLAQDCVEG